MQKMMCIASVLTLAACEQRQEANGTVQQPELVVPAAAPSVQDAEAKPPSPMKADSLEEAVGRFTAARLASENASSRAASERAGESAEDAFEYVAVGIELRRDDWDKDGDLDGVAVVDTCEVYSCHTTTRSAVVGVFQRQQDGWTLTNSKAYPIYAEIEGTGPEGVTLKVTSYGPDDPHCCPTKVEQKVLPLRPVR